MTFYDKFLLLCSERGISPTRAAESAGLARSAVSKWKSDSSLIPSGKTIELLCSYFRVSPSFFNGEERDGFFVSDVSEDDKQLIRLLLAAPDPVKQSIRVLLSRNS